MNDQEDVFRSYVEGPRWANFGSAIKRACIDAGLSCAIEEDKGFIRTTTYFTISGPSNRLNAFKKSLHFLLNEWNSR